MLSICFCSPGILFAYASIYFSLCPFGKQNQKSSGHILGQILLHDLPVLPFGISKSQKEPSNPPVYIWLPLLASFFLYCCAAFTVCKCHIWINLSKTKEKFKDVLHPVSPLTLPFLHPHKSWNGPGQHTRLSVPLCRSSGSQDDAAEKSTCVTFQSENAHSPYTPIANSSPCEVSALARPGTNTRSVAVCLCLVNTTAHFISYTSCTNKRLQFPAQVTDLDFSVQVDLRVTLRTRLMEEVHPYLGEEPYCVHTYMGVAPATIWLYCTCLRWVC